MLYLTFFTLGVWLLVCPVIFIDIVVTGNHIAMAVVIAIALCQKMLCLEILWQKLLPLLYFYFSVADEGHFGRCYGHM